MSLKNHIKVNYALKNKRFKKVKIYLIKTLWILCLFKEKTQILIIIKIWRLYKKAK